MDLQKARANLRELTEKQDAYVAIQAELLRSQKKTAVVFCALCFFVGVLVGAFLLDRHYQRHLNSHEAQQAKAPVMKNIRTTVL